MSSISFQGFKPASSDEIPFEAREPEDFTTAVLNHSCVLEFNRVCKRARIVNEDTVNNLTVRLHSNTGAARVIPPNSDAVINEWFSDIFITPDNVTGNGQLELDLVKIEDARRVI